jgi:aminoglycoside phosphotransferase (APT) family kinase protein
VRDARSGGAADEIPLGGGWSVEGVVRVGDTVRRPPVFATQLMRDVLAHLELVGFENAPRRLGLDEQGRDVLSWVDGDTFSDCRAIVWRDEQLAASGRLLRRYHDATAGSPLSGAHDVVCHGDFGPWNLIWRESLPFCIIDFDNAHSGERIEDIGYALRAHLNLALVDVPAPEQGRRARIFAAAYGVPFDIAAALARAYDDAEAKCLANGWQRELAGLKAERTWLVEHAGELT